MKLSPFFSESGIDASEVLVIPRKQIVCLFKVELDKVIIEIITGELYFLMGKNFP